MSAITQFHEAANGALIEISRHLPPGAKLALVIYTAGNLELDIVLKGQDLNPDDVVSTLRRRGGVSQDGVLDAATGAMTFGYQNASPPPEGHWAQRFWDVGRAEGELRGELRHALKECRKELNSCQRVIHYHGDFNPDYVNHAQAAIQLADKALAEAPA